MVDSLHSDLRRALDDVPPQKDTVFEFRCVVEFFSCLSLLAITEDVDITPPLAHLVGEDATNFTACIK